MIKDLKDIIKYTVRTNYRKQIQRKLKATVFFESSLSNPKGMVLVIERMNPNVGTFSDYIVFLRYIELAVRSSYIPLIDRMHKKTGFMVHFHKDVNTWEVYFEQPVVNEWNERCIMEASEGEWEGYCVHKINTDDFSDGGISLLRCDDEDVVNFWRLIAKKYIRLNAGTRLHVKEWEEKLIRGKRVLGVPVREGYRKLMKEMPQSIQGHSLQAEDAALAEDIKYYLSAWRCDYIFLTCQTMETEVSFKKIFGEKVIVYPRNRKKYDDIERIAQNEKDEYKNELDYITEVYLLSRCTSLLCSQNSGSEAAFIMSEGYEHMKCYDLGVFH